MRKTTLLFSLVILFSQFVSAQEIDFDQHSLVVKKTATWCPKCGTWGWDIFVDMVEDLKEDNVVFIAAHYSGELMTDAGLALSNNFGVAGQPNFYFNGEDLDVSSSNTDDKAEEFRTKIAEHNEGESVVGIGIEASLEEDQLDITLAIQFSDEVEGDYQYSLYLLEDPLVFRQAGHPDGDTTSHKKILRTHLTENALADLVASGSPVKEEIYEFSHQLSLEEEWDRSNLELVAIVWTKDEEKLSYLNAASHDVELISNAQLPEAEIEEVLVGFQDNLLHLNINSKENYQSKINIYTGGTGQLVFTTEQTIHSGQNFYKLPIRDISSGSYIVTIQIPQRIPISRKIMKF